MGNSQPLRIRFFVNFVHEQGTYFRFHNLAVALARLGQKVQVYGLDHNTKSRRRWETRDGISYHIIPSARGLSLVSPLVHPASAFRMRLCAGTEPCDVAHLFQPFPAAFWAWRACRAPTKFYDWDDLWIGGILPRARIFTRGWLEGAMIARLETKLPSMAGHVTVCSQYLANKARALGAARVTVIVNGLWPFPPIGKDEARRVLGLAPDALYFGFMGRTCAELDWIFEAMRSTVASQPTLRLAICGPPPKCLDGLDPAIRTKIDYLGQLSAAQTKVFASALDLGLLPLDDTPFNQSRFPIKYAEHMAAGRPVLCSDVGECGLMAKAIPGVILAGTTRAEWVQAFESTTALLASHKAFKVDQPAVDKLFSWEHIGGALLDLYRKEARQQIATGSP
jgi:glycosyltransferase involved in cell wall biosynthesis